jgi:heat shock protein HtpX
MPAAATLGLSGYRWNNNLKSALLLAAFPFLLLTLLGGIFYVFGVLALGAAGAEPSSDPFESFGLASLCGSRGPGDLALAAVAQWWPLVFGIAAAWVLVGYFLQSAIVRTATGARPVTREHAPELYNLLENLCISRGMRMPRLDVIESDAMNAYASGVDERSYIIAVTSGLVAGLGRDELEAVLAHELSHIRGNDCRLLIITVVFVGMISLIAQMLWRSLRLGARGRDRSRKGGGAIMLLMLIAAIAFLIGYVLALILRFAISRRREFLADAGAVELTKNPGALIGALRKISQNPHLPNVPSEVRQMFIENPPSAFNLGGLFATHPPIAARIRMLEQLGGRLPE